MNKKWISISLVIAMVCSCLTACGGNDTVGDIELEAGYSAIYIEKDGEVAYGVGELFDKEYYDKKELKEIIKDEIDEFNAGPYTASTDAAKLDYFGVQEDVAKLVIDFETVKDYVNFERYHNGLSEDEIYIGEIETTDKRFGELPTECYKVKNGAASDETVDISEVVSEDNNIMIFNQKIKVQFEEADILFISPNCTISDGVVTVTDDETSYIVYR